MNKYYKIIKDLKCVVRFYKVDINEQDDLLSDFDIGFYKNQIGSYIITNGEKVFFDSLKKNEACFFTENIDIASLLKNNFIKEESEDKYKFDSKICNDIEEIKEILSYEEDLFNTDFLLLDKYKKELENNLVSLAI